jgi:integrase
MKANRPHRVFAPWEPKNIGLLFSHKNKALSLNAMRSILVKRKLGWTVHGIRSTFSSWATEQGFDSRLIERQLAHTDTNQVRAAYDRSDLLDQRGAMMHQWWLALSKGIG